MKLPIIIVNFKTRIEGTGKKALKLAEIADKIAKKERANIIVAVQPTDIEKIARSVSISVYAEHIDPILPGSHTGCILPEAIKEVGAKGTLINHSERKIELGALENSIKRCKEIGLKSVVCASSIDEAKRITHFNPDYIAFEDPILIGTLRSISKINPDTVKLFANTIKRINPKIIPLCGAGVATGEDVKAALKLGTKGVLVATAIVKAKNPAKAIEDLVKGFD